MKLNNKGFSLVELMVVVAIIGILASVAVPSVNRYMAKSRQSEAKTNLASLYTAEKAFFSEYNVYDSRFGVIGFAPEGRLRYNIGFSAAGVQAAAANGYTAAPPANASFQTSTGAAAAWCGVSGAMVNGCTNVNGATNALPPAPAAVGPDTPVTTVTTFISHANARISQTSGQDDIWQINETKNLNNVQNGIL